MWKQEAHKILPMVSFDMVWVDQRPPGKCDQWTDQIQVQLRLTKV
jgi:hypothetical protein